jgi:hypothetical protein
MHHSSYFLFASDAESFPQRGRHLKQDDLRRILVAARTLRRKPNAGAIDMQLKTFFRNTTTEAELASAQETSYASWREASEAVAEAYRSWAAAPRDERWLAHAAYLAALEREEHAARAYQELVEQPRGAVGGGSRGK